MAFTYTIVDSFSVAFLLILFLSTGERSQRLMETRCFRLIVLYTMVALLGDMVAWQLDGRPGSTERILLWCANIGCYLLSGTMSFTWLLYTGQKLNRLSRISKLGWAGILLPCLVLLVFSLLTPWTGVLFYLDGNNIYQRGPLFALQMVVPFGYMFAAAVWSVVRACRERLQQQRRECLTLASFILFPLAGGILQLAIYGVSLAWPCCALSLMLVYVGMQNQRISLDALTGLSNRGQLDKYLFNSLDRAEDGLSFALFMLDIDEFKRINDELGHIAGDAALIDAANILRRSLADDNAFLARYGGDEFAVVLHYTAGQQVTDLLARIQQEARRHNSVSGAPYELVFSIGYVCYDHHRYSNYHDMLTAADAQMYVQKRLHKAQLRGRSAVRP